MGTRNLTMVVLNGVTKVAQYGQWDGYPERVGQEALDFIRNVNLNDFKEKLSYVRFLNESDIKEREDYLKSLGVKNGWIPIDKSNLFDTRFPLDSRDHAADILNIIMNTEGEVALKDASNFAGQSLLCEWCYVIDLDTHTFEVYKGFNKTELTEEDRFFNLSFFGEEYQPVKMVASYPISDLPLTITIPETEEE